MKVVVFAGGVGGAKLAHGLSMALPPHDLSVVVNVGDDFTHLGLRICPDLDTVMYNLAGLDNRETGWGIKGDSFEALGGLDRLGAPTWFRLGDRDLATHLQRSVLLSDGFSLTEVTARLCRSLKIKAAVLPACDTPVPTRVLTDEGELDFQEYFVRRHCEPVVQTIRFAGVETAEPTAAVAAALEAADAVVFAPSNPFVSIDPILALPGIRPKLGTLPVVAVSPIVGGAAIKGPAAKMLFELGAEVSASAVARHYKGLLDGFVLDEVDAPFAREIEALDLSVRVVQSVMRTDDDRLALARECLELVKEIASSR